MWCARRRCGRDWRSRYSQSIFARAVSFSGWERPKLRPSVVLAEIHGSAGPISCSSIDVYLGKWNQSGSSLLCTRKSGEDRTNRMPGSVRQPNRPQSWLPMCEGATLNYITLQDCFAFSCHHLYTQSCPVAAYADDEYTWMWAASHAVGLIGLLLNVYMTMTWWYHFELSHWSVCCFVVLLCLVFTSICMLVRSQVSWRKKSIYSCSIPSKVMCVRGPPVCNRRNDSVFSFKVCLALFGMHDGGMVKREPRHTLIVRKSMMRCFWCCSTGNGTMCAINRSSIFILLFIQIHLCDLTRNLFVNITANSSSNEKKGQMLMFRVLSTGIPCLLLAISYGGLFECTYLSLVASTFTRSWVDSISTYAYSWERKWIWCQRSWKDR